MPKGYNFNSLISPASFGGRGMFYYEGGRYMGDKRKIAIYARKSKLTETGKSVDNQITKCKACAVLRFDATDDDIIIYHDDGKSGFYADRPEYMRMLKDIENNRIRAVICYKFDRISRRTIDLLNLFERLKAKKCHLCRVRIISIQVRLRVRY